MKRVIAFIMILSCTYATSQNINDVVRYSTENTLGTARFQAMGGAFGALGGDFSSLNVNPAGSAVFNHSQFTISGSNYNRDNEVLFGNSVRNSNLNSVELNQVGGVFVFESSDSPWKKIALAFNYDMVQNFDNEFVAVGNTTQGIDNYFLNFAQGQALGPLRVQDGEFIEDAYLDIGSSLGFGAQQAFLGFQAGIIEPDVDDDANTAYFSNAAYSSVNQEYLQRTTGYNSKFTLNFAGQYQENLYLGASLNFHNILYDRLTLLDESGYDTDSPVQFTTFDNLLRTEGYGFSFSVGGIAKLNENIRVGGSYQSPTWYELTDDISQRINSSLAVSDINFIDFGIINFFEEYRIKTPSKLTGSVAVVFGKDGLLSFDYGYQDMSQAELRPTSDPNFSEENDVIANTLGVVNSYRVGGEYRIDQVSLRAGYRFEQSPYENGNTIGDLTAYSGGIGYNFGGSRLDLGVSRTDQDVSEALFDAGLNSTAMINRINTNVTLGYTLKF
ncbi:OmpP1/FadL family transporter [Flagellimonas flava]|uniref:Outer membrane protein transport protein (OMPP1/FadL/TodX) n=1 Tax=Flagellimonas flava TaxID=570519 RepID=A0A1M5NGN7_9FLAO|nr:outer membrane protein transport protein [Allomuricauda flava]SHG88662.1 Outer membrane protein transport protein (OMPP1/FadL/TodX) [Allomuricauda flava]